MTVVSRRTMDAEAKRNLLDVTAEANDYKEQKKKLFGWGNFFSKRASQWTTDPSGSTTPLSEPNLYNILPGFSRPRNNLHCVSNHLFLRFKSIYTYHFYNSLIS